MTDQPDPVKDIARDIASKHVARSIEEMRDPAKVEQWADGPRAEEFAASALGEALNEILEPKEPETEGEDAT